MVVAHAFSHFEECGVLPDLGRNPGLLRSHADSSPLSRQGNPSLFEALKTNTTPNGPSTCMGALLSQMP